MADTITKSVAARVPMDTYIEIIKTAAELRMTISDYLIMKLFQESKNEQLQQELAEKEKAINQINSELTQMKGAKLRLEKDGVKTASSAKEHSARITALTTENLSLKGQISSMRQSNTSSNTSMNTSLDKLTIKLKESEASLKTAWQDLNRVMDMNTILSQDLNKAKNQIKELSARIAATDKANNEAYKVLNIYNQDNDGIFSGPPIGDVTMGKLKKLLCV